MMHLCLLWYPVLRSRRDGALRRLRNCGSLALDAPAAAELAVELDQATKAAECRRVLIAVASREHARKVSGRRDGRAEALAKRFAVRRAA